MGPLCFDRWFRDPGSFHLTAPPFVGQYQQSANMQQWSFANYLQAVHLLIDWTYVPMSSVSIILVVKYFKYHPGLGFGLFGVVEAWSLPCSHHNSRKWGKKSRAVSLLQNVGNPKFAYITFSLSPVVTLGHMAACPQGRLRNVISK